MAIQAPQYPAPIAPSFQSFAERQRMAIDDAIAASEEQEERVAGVLKAGAKTGFEYDQMLRGYMEAKYANPNITFWDYVTKPSVAGAFRAEGRKKIAARITAGEDIKDIPGMSFGERQKAGFRGIVGADKREREARLAEIAKDEPRVQKMAEQEISEVTAGLPENVYESQLASIKDIGKDVAGVKETFVKRLDKTVEPLGQLDPAQLLSKSPEATEAAEKSLETIDKLIGGKKPVVDVATAPAGEAAKAGIAPTGEAAKAGLKETLGKGAAGLAYGYSAVTGVQKLAKGETGQERLGGAVQAAGGVAGLVAMTNFWNPVGWAASIPLALSVGGGLMGGGGRNDALSKTPLGRYRRRVGIG